MLALQSVKYGIFSGLIFAYGIAYKVNNAKVDAPESPPLKPGVDRFCVAAYSASPPSAHAHLLADLIARKYPDKIETYYYFSMFSYFKFLEERFSKVSFAEIGCEHLKGHDTSPFVYIEREPVSAAAEGKKPLECIGGDDKFIEFVNRHFSDPEIIAFANKPLPMSQMLHYNKAPATCYGNSKQQ